MSIYIYNTNLQWYHYLSSRKIVKDVNFWRKDIRAFNLNIGDFFYFRLKNHCIAGRGQFVSAENHSVPDAWNLFQSGCGTSTFNDFQVALRNTYPDLDQTTKHIKCIILTNIQWLLIEDFITIPETVFNKNTVGGKRYHNIDVINNINQQFNSAFNNTLPATIHNNEIEFDSQYSEGSVKLSKHKKIERNSNLINQVKEMRQWDCDICTENFKNIYGVNYIEAHHKIPLYSSGITLNTTDDIALLCPNCHRAAHKIMLLEQEKNYEEIKIQLRAHLALHRNIFP